MRTSILTYVARTLSPLVDFARVVLPGREEIERVLHSLAGGEKTASEIVAAFPEDRRPFMLRSLGWLAKLGLLSVVS